MHDKFMVVDGEYVWTGSYNFTFNDTYRNDNNAILINSPNLAQNYTAEFEEMFIRKKFGNDSPANTIYKQLNLEGSEVTTCFSPEDRCAKMLVGLINGSQASIRFMAYSFTDDAIGRAMLQRSRAGVDVSGVFETRGSETEFSEYAYLKQNNMDVRLDGNPYNMHHKVIILDDETVITGSYNFSNNASNYNDENLLIIENPGLAKKFLEEYKRVYSLAVTK
jgi:phosphatidylserine/phosphatidylglycerophosphate/cardiolipin synthase-like enzyme